VTEWQEPKAVDFMLDDCETWAVVGLSGNEARTAFRIASLLQRNGKRIVPIHPRAPVVLGEQGYPTLADVPFEIDVAVGARGVWFQLGVVDEDAFERTREAGVPMVMDTCPAIEWGKR
jgi:predicted CoA-binding protein